MQFEETNLDVLDMKTVEKFKVSVNKTFITVSIL